MAVYLISERECDPVKAQELSETIANAVTHGLGLVASVIALPLLIVTALRRGDPLEVTGAAVFGVSLVLLYGASTIYHSFPQSASSTLFRVLDHSAIYVLIAGSYTPFALGPLRGKLGYSLLAVMWTIAVFGLIMTSRSSFVRPILTVVASVGMGWLCAVATKPLITQVGAAGFWWLLAGGLFYMGGIVFYATDKRLRYGHAVWHLFVLAGSTCHFFAVLWHSARVPS
jgi:hemolysin III